MPRAPIIPVRFRTARRIALLTCLTATVAARPADKSTIEITSGISSGPGSIREAIEKANKGKGIKRIVSRLPAGTMVHVFRQLPSLSAPGVEFEASGMTLEGGTCVRPDGRPGCDGLLVTGPDIVVRNLRSTKFTFDGIAVRGIAAKRVRIEDCESVANQDDGVGVSHGASEVTIENCTLEGNGFRTKGKGVLVFEYASATLVGNRVRGNRDGVTISRRATASLVRNTIEDNYDKGFGVTGAEATGRDNVIRNNGKTGPEGTPGPNADGLRVSLDSRVTLENSEITGNGDIGVVALDNSRVTLVGGRIAGHKNAGVHARDMAIVELRGVTIERNAQGDYRVDNEAKIIRGEPTPGMRPHGKR
jgi:hypothetical protein